MKDLKPKEEDSGRAYNLCLNCSIGSGEGTISTSDHSWRWERQIHTAVLVSVVYGAKDLGVRDLWRTLSHIVDSIDVEYWLVLGDFNAVADMSEVCGASGDIRLVIEDFQRFLIDTGLITLPMQGALFTWHNCNDTSRSLWKRLDKMLVKDRWLDRWPSAFNVSFTPRTSNHSPSILKGD
ncbi:UNVERIFIED_CONTAM: hypothetical protein Scaly_0047000 [Sesamum calycinum]|uniref:Endonuclease/exonuclease/phosphatase domain-containing protein n=1 Tax=Sesamum calycinum TaxID=2727403 RepID=A0AAW2SWP9_9LAMI